MEILDHSPGAVIFERILQAGPLLMDHMREDLVGRVRDAWLGDDRRCWSKVQFSRSARASEVFQDVVDDIRAMVSCRYRVHEMVLVERAEGKPDVYRVTKWEPYEISLVSMPADITVGVGRELVERADQIAARAAVDAGRHESMKIGKTHTEPRLDPVVEGGGGGQAAEPAPAPAPRAVTLNESEIIEREQARVAAIDDIVGKVAHLFDASDLGRQFKQSRRSVAEFHAAITERLAGVQAPVVTQRKLDNVELGMPAADLRRYSVLRAVNAMLSGDWTHAGLEREASVAVAKVMGREPNGMFVPYEAIGMDPLSRELNSSAGGAAIDTTLAVGQFIELMRDASIIAKLGATLMPGLTSDVDIPKELLDIGGEWIDNETYVGATSYTPTIGAVNLSPKTFRIRVDISRKMLKQPSLSMEAFVRRIIARKNGHGMDLAAVNGSGTGATPQGIINMPAVPVVAIGANGGALAWPHIVDLEAALGNHKQLGGIGYLTNTSTVGSMKKTPKHATAATPGFLIDADGKCNGFPLLESNGVPGNLTKGSGTNLSALICGAWQALLVGLWGALDIELDRSAPGLADRGAIVLRGFQDADIRVQYTGAFAVCKDIANS